MKSIHEPGYVLSHKGGLTLVEVLISMGIFAVGFLAIAGLLIGTTKNNVTGNTLTEATMLARAKIESLKALSLDQLDVACPQGDEPEIINQLYARQCEISSLSGSNTIKTIRVTISWKKLGKLRRVVFETNTRGRGT